MNILTYAAIDIGSNAVRLLIKTIYETSNGTVFNKTSLVRSPIRLGDDVFTQSKISEKTIQRLGDAMKAYHLLMNIYNVDKYRAFATSAMREAENSDEMIRKVKKKSGIKIEVISGEEEAKIIFSSELNEFLHSENCYLYVDVGGGSTEISLLNKGKVLASRSFPIGTVRILDNKIDESDLKKIVKPWVNEITKGKRVELVGSGGNINYIFKMSRKEDGKYLSGSYLQRQYEIMKNMTYEERAETYNMKPDRADVIVPALEIYTSVMKWAHASRIYVPKIGAADGMITLMYKNRKN
ncbi:MAG: exopolyphosphatase [Flavobacteriaceae bacterium]|jgi:exopolyphosphatase/guanosine-5'-triphosphate,3'-diphosphate pyrophosphatase|nr:exopolyphosphatase [Flavobacteriaceae bacterium]